MSYFDYSSAGAYFVTICCFNRQPILGRIQSNECLLSVVGKLCKAELDKLDDRFQGLKTLESVIMPNHMHAVFLLPAKAEFSLPQVIQAFKSLSTMSCISAVKAGLVPAFDKKILQRGYYEHVVRDEEGLYRIRQYIQDNPAQWSLDRENDERAGENDFYRWLDTHYPPVIRLK